MANEEVVKELVHFLSKNSPSLQVRISSSECLLGLTGSEDGRNLIKSMRNSFINIIIDLLSDPCKDLNINAIKCIVNLTSEESFLDMLMEDSLISKLFDIILNHKCNDQHLIELSENAVLALSNKAHWQIGAQNILRFLQKPGNSLLFYKVTEKFFQDIDHLHHLASLFSNLSQIKDARLMFLDQEKLIFQRILSFISFEKSNIRKKGVVATVKNCSFEVDSHKWLLSDKVDSLPRLLLPLAGNEEFDDEDNDKLPFDLQYLGENKEREADPVIRKMLVEAIFQMCATEQCRKYIKDHNTYVIMRELHTWEQNEDCKEAVENLVALLIADEPEEGMRDLNKIEIPQSMQDQLNKT